MPLGAPLCCAALPPRAKEADQAEIVHAIAALVYIALSLGHIYLGTIGLEGSCQAMRSGYVDEVWAKEHHEYWYDEIKSSQRAAPRSVVSAGAPNSGT